MIQINYRDGKPIYEQIKDGFRKLIISKVLQVDEKLPSVRELAKNLAINPNTIQRAYRDLESEGFVYTVAGKGCFVAGISDQAFIRKNELYSQLDEVVKELGFLNVSKEEIISHIEEGSVNHD